VDGAGVVLDLPDARLLAVWVVKHISTEVGRLELLRAGVVPEDERIYQLLEPVRL